MTDDCRIDIADNDARRGYELVTMNMYREMDGFLVLMSVHNTQNDHGRDSNSATCFRRIGRGDD